MSKFSLKAALAVLELLLSVIAKSLRLVDVIRDFLDDGEINDSTRYLSRDLDAFKSDMTDWLGSFSNSLNDERTILGD